MELAKLILVTVLLIFLFSQLIKLIKWYANKRRVAAIVNKIPGPKAYPFFGTIWELLGIPRDGKSI
jgi:hypothetical protein